LIKDSQTAKGYNQLDHIGAKSVSSLMIDIFYPKIIDNGNIIMGF